jgi:Legume lectin domain/Chitobiase/beta-hexosaminidase C-terminal domain
MCDQSSLRSYVAQPEVFAAACKRTVFFVLGSLGLALFGGPASSLLAQTPVTVPTWRYDLTHSGQNTHETELTPANVNVNSFGKLFSHPVDGSVYAQPLYVPGLTMSDGKVHNVFFIATEHDSVYAFDADSNGGANANPIWQISLLSTSHGAAAGATTIPWSPALLNDIEPEIGITGTPVINPGANTMYVVAASEEGGVYRMRLHAINILNGAERSNSPVLITATIAGTGNGSSGGELTFSPYWQNQRPALDYYNGYVYIGFASHGDNGPYHGWIFAYNGSSMAQTDAFCLTPNGAGAGVWAAGAGLPIDGGGTAGRLYMVSGNGTYGSSEYGESIVNFSLAGGKLTPTDSFTAFNQAKLSQSDLDQGSGGVLMVPDEGGANANILINVGKEGRILVLNRNHLGGYAAGAESNTNILQDILGETKGLWSTPASWNGNVYLWGSPDVPKLFTLNAGVLDRSPSSEGSITSLFPGASFSISSNGTQDGIAWAVRSDAYTTHGQEVMYAWNANNLSDLLYHSDQDSARDTAGQAMKFAIPVVTNGKVYLVANHQVDVYGLFHGEPSAAVPVITPDGGTFAASESVKLTSATASADIYYTLDGSVPTPASTLYKEPITITTDTTLNAIASASGYIQSGVSSAKFTISDQTPAVTFAPVAGTYAAAQKVTLSDTDKTAKIYYTTNGATPTTSSKLYSGPIAVGASMTIKAIAVGLKLNSNVSTAAYVIQASGTSINFANGFSSVAGLTLNGSTVNTDDSRLQLTNGGLNQAGSVFWDEPIGIGSFTTSFSFQLSDAQADGFTFTIQNVGPKELGGSGAALGYAHIKKSVAIKFDIYSNAGEGTDSTGVYTDGATPTVPAVNMTSSGVILRSGDAMVANITYNGTTLVMKLTDAVINKTFTLSKAINIPSVVGADKAYVGFTGSSGGLSASQKIVSWTYTAQ